MISHLDKNRIENFKNILIRSNSSETKIKRIFKFSSDNNNELIEDYFPTPAQKIRIQTNYDDWKLETRLLPKYSIVYNVPVINPYSKYGPR